MASKNIILTEVSEGDLQALLQVCRKERKRTGQVVGQVVHDWLQTVGSRHQGEADRDWLQTVGSRHQGEADREGAEQVMPGTPGMTAAGKDGNS